MPKLSDRELTKLKVAPGQKDRLVFDTTTTSLGVRVTAKGTKTFIVQWTDPATRRKIREPLGTWGNLTIEQARTAAKARSGDVARGINPKAERAKIRAEADRIRSENALTFDALLTDWATLHLASRRPRYASEATRAVRFLFAGLLNRPAARITQPDAINALDKLIRAGKAAMAGRTLAYARAAFRWAQKRGKVPRNPFQDLPIAAGTRERDRVLSDDELAEVWAAAGLMDYPFGPYFKLLILTLQRREEVAGMRWSELSADHGVWTIPADRMKNARPHVVHLSEPARAVLEGVRQIEDQDFVFSTTGKTQISGFSKAKTELDAHVMAARSDNNTHRKREALTPWRLHDLRRTGVTKLAAMGFDIIVADKLLAHQPGKLRGVAGVYQRYDFATERANALNAWAAAVTCTHRGATVTATRRSR